MPIWQCGSTTQINFYCIVYKLGTSLLKYCIAWQHSCELPCETHWVTYMKGGTFSRERWNIFKLTAKKMFKIWKPEASLLFVMINLILFSVLYCELHSWMIPFKYCHLVSAITYVNIVSHILCVYSCLIWDNFFSFFQRGAFSSLILEACVKPVIKPIVCW